MTATPSDWYTWVQTSPLSSGGMDNVDHPTEAVLSVQGVR